MDAGATTCSATVSSTLLRRIRVPLILWIGVLYFVLTPFYWPRGPYFHNRFQALDLALGIPLLPAALITTLLAVVPPARRRAIELRLAAAGIAILFAVLLIDLSGFALRLARWDYWFDEAGITRADNVQ